MKKLTSFSVNYPITILMLILGVLLLGYISFSKLGVDLFPNLNNPRIFVEIRAGERPPEEIEQQFVESMEALAITDIVVSFPTPTDPLRGDAVSHGSMMLSPVTLKSSMNQYQSKSL